MGSFHQAVAQESRISGRLLSHHNRFNLVKTFTRPPGLNADIQNSAESARMIVDADFEVKQ